MRIGIGYDVHPFDATRPLHLGGVRIDGSPGLSGHSDADALLHAVIDALLGAAGLGDIGQHFPAGDPAYKDIDSRELLRRTRDLLAEKGYRAGNIDATVIAESPRLAPHLPEMRSAIAGVIGIDESRVSVKATTHEGLGAIGRGEGIAAMAVALIE
ncbi:MAG TPA: 2-C-methyl-D-erythritol 2,4-cyclodiphosphate synthase [Dehalococcoidia bacterium]|nr:2-C-methyl-D-erythritol 2,4-cyclodiphosphate synthase [Dehalococcoidia bacterium]